MGTLKNQDPRQDNLTTDVLLGHGNKIKKVAEKLDISFNEALNLYQVVAKINDYDVKDEQLAGFGEILEDTNASIREIAREL